MTYKSIFKKVKNRSVEKEFFYPEMKKIISYL
jgi:hypothetical protein